MLRLQFAYTKVNKIDRKEKAFTLFELLVVLGIIALVTGMSVPFFSSFSKSLKLKSQARSIASVIRSTREYAITNNAVYSVLFDETNNRYWSWDESNNEIVDRAYKLEHLISFDEITFTNTIEEYPAVRFNSRGTLVGGSGSIYIREPSGRIYRITVLNTTGRVRIYNSDNR